MLNKNELKTYLTFADFIHDMFIIAFSSPFVE